MCYFYAQLHKTFLSFLISHFIAPLIISLNLNFKLTYIESNKTIEKKPFGF